MLVLSRNVGKKLMIGINQEITITVLEISDQQVKLGVEADRTIPILREEIIRTVRRNRFLKNSCEVLN